MKALGKIIGCFGFVLVVCFAIVVGAGAQATPGATTPPETVEVPVNVIICDDDTCLCLDAECASPRTLDGAVVSSFDATGTQIDACTVSSEFDDFDGCFLDIPADGGGSFEITGPAGTEGYVLKSQEPEFIGNLNLRLWSFIPDGEEPAGGVPVNVVACVIANCTDPVTMDGAELVSYQDGQEVDRCVVESEADDFDGCILFIPADKANVDITPAAGYEDSVLVSEEPDVYESDERGRIYVWTFVPDGAEPTAVPTEAPATADSTAAPVTALPETGAGHDAGSEAALIFLGLGGVAALALAGLGIHRAPR